MYAIGVSSTSALSVYLFNVLFYRSRHIKPLAQLLIALRFYALGSMLITVGDFAGVSKSSVCAILPRVSVALARLRPEFVKMPANAAEMVEVSKGFYAIAKFPRTIGAIDCTHIKIQSPGGQHAENYRNRKGWFSLNVQTVAGADTRILNIVARWPGATHDQTIFNNSTLKFRLERGDFRNYILVGDSGYRNTSYLATPFLLCDTPAKNLYNESQIRTRNVVERSYGVLKRRFPVLSLGMRVQLHTVQAIIVACAVLHNIAVEEHERVPPDELEGFQDMLDATVVPGSAAADNDANVGNARDTLLRYFAQLHANQN